jgi:hypothetical protein
VTVDGWDPAYLNGLLDRWDAAQDGGDGDEEHAVAAEMADLLRRLAGRPEGARHR